MGLTIPQFGPGVPTRLNLDVKAGDGDGAGVLAMARGLLDLRVLRESDWTGSIESSIQNGLVRWLNQDLGAKTLSFFAPLRLIYSNDLSRYFTKLDDRMWRDEMHARAFAPIGFFALSWQQDGFNPVFVAEKAEEIEAIFPGAGFGVIRLLEEAFKWCCQGWGFGRGHYAAREGEKKVRKEHGVMQQAAAQARAMNRASGEDQSGEDSDLIQRMLDDMAGAGYSAKRFEARIPMKRMMGRETSPHVFMEQFRRMERDKRLRKWHGLFSRVWKLAHLWADCVQTHVGADHLPLIVNSGKRMEPNGTIYLSWAPDDEMHRIVDDYYEHALRGGALSDLVWLHGFQTHHDGTVSETAKWQAQVAERQRSEYAEWIDRAPDGSLSAAVSSLKRAVDMIVLIDQICGFLHTPVPAFTYERSPRMTLGW